MVYAEYDRTTIAITLEESRTLSDRSASLRTRATETVEGSRRLRERSATLNEKIYEMRQLAKR